MTQSNFDFALPAAEGFGVLDVAVLHLRRVCWKRPRQCSRDIYYGTDGNIRHLKNSYRHIAKVATRRHRRLLNRSTFGDEICTTGTSWDRIFCFFWGFRLATAQVLSKVHYRAQAGRIAKAFVLSDVAGESLETPPTARSRKRRLLLPPWLVAHGWPSATALTLKKTVRLIRRCIQVLMT